MSNVENFSSLVVADLKSQQQLDIAVPDGAFEMARELTRMAEYLPMPVASCADMLIQLANLA